MFQIKNFTVSIANEIWCFIHLYVWNYSSQIMKENTHILENSSSSVDLLLTCQSNMVIDHRVHASQSTSPSLPPPTNKFTTISTSNPHIVPCLPRHPLNISGRIYFTITSALLILKNKWINFTVKLVQFT